MPIGTAMRAVTPTIWSVPSMAWRAPPPASSELMLRWLPVHHVDEASMWTPLAMTVQRIHTRGTMARTKAHHMTIRATTSLTARARWGWRIWASASPPGAAARGRGCVVDGGVVGDAAVGGGAHSVKAFLRSMTTRAMLLTTKVSTKRTRPAAM